MALTIAEAAAAAVRRLQGWYGADSYAANTGLYHWDDPDFAHDPEGPGPVVAALIDSYGYHDAVEDMYRWWNSANAITALIDYMLVTNTRAYLPAVEHTFTHGPNAFTVDPKAVGAGAGVGAGVGIAAGAAAGFAVGGPVGAVIGGIIGAIAGAYSGASVAVETFARIYLTNFMNSASSGLYDDEGWWALAWLKAYDLTNDDKYLNMAVTIFDDMTKGWDGACNGGIYWKKDHADRSGHKPYKNAIANELFLAVGAGLCRRLPKSAPQFGDFLGWAEAEWRWFENSGLIDRHRHLINDAQSTGPCRNDHVEVWTYNQGVILSALCDLAEITGNKSYLLQAQQIANALIRNPVTPSSQPAESGIDPDSKILVEFDDETTSGPELSIDHCQFKGIFVRNLATLCLKTGAGRYATFIRRNAASAIRYMNDAKFGHRWDQKPDMVDFVRQTAGIDLLNAALAVRDVASDLSCLDPLLLDLQRRGRDLSYLGPLLLDDSS